MTGGTTYGSLTGGDASTDGATGAATDNGTASSDGSTSGSGGPSPCEGACERLVDCEIEEDAAECLSWCYEMREEAVVADPQIFPECAALVEDFLECIAQDDTCFESDLCSDLDLAIEEQCGCESGWTGNAEECSYNERCGAVSREVHCAGVTCVCTVGGEVVGECQSQAMICVDPSAAGECCGWTPFEQFHLRSLPDNLAATPRLVTPGAPANARHNPGRTAR